MLLNDDLSVRTLVHAGELDWVPSPAKGVERRMLFRIGDEKARATSIVRYAPGSHFACHGHPGGEEFLVLEGTFQDETGDFPVGTYVRNPPGTAHAPGSDDGCTILVKLWQFGEADRERIVCRPGEGASAALRPGVASSHVLFESASEHVMLETWQPNTEINLVNPEGLEMLVLGGSFESENDRLTRWSWLRLPPGEPLTAHIGPEEQAHGSSPRRCSTMTCALSTQLTPARWGNHHKRRTWTMMQDWNAYLENMMGRVGELTALSPELGQGLQTFRGAVEAPGHLPAKMHL
ncbi:cupin domain-containing protein [Novosphingobium panipatense]|uniref:cupin domain-containing protein n=1 Tax=Novosphingobium panipatense TaxID=428991 RepID=UPI0036121BCF